MTTTKNNNTKHSWLHRRGVTAIEVLMATSLLISAFALVAGIGSRLLLVAKQERHQRLAIHELANQLEHLSSLNRRELENSLEQLKPTNLVQQVLPNSKMHGQILSNEDGERLVLSIEWARGPDAKPITMVAWLGAQGVQP